MTIAPTASRPAEPAPRVALSRPAGSERAVTDIATTTLEIPSGPLATATRLAGGVAGALAGAAVGMASGVLLGGVLGAGVGYHGSTTMTMEILQPLPSVAGLGGALAHRAARKLVGRLLGEKAGKIAGAVVGTLVGGATGVVIGALGMGVSCADAGARLGTSLAEKVVGPAPRPPDRDPRPTYERGRGKQIPTPDGKIERDQHHWYYNNAALEVLAADAAHDPELARIHAFLTSDPDYLHMLQMGGWNLDTYLGTPLPHVNLSTFHHFAEPFMPGMKAAGWQSRQCYDRAVDAWKAGDYKLALYYLGAAVHIPQDQALPQHAIGHVGFVGKMLGHQMMERWQETQFDRLKPASGGLYLEAAGPEDFTRQIAEMSAQDYPEAVLDASRFVHHRLEKGRRGESTDIKDQTDFCSPVYRRGVERAVRLTPGFFRMFFRHVESLGYPIPTPPTRAPAPASTSSTA
jgi:hypothetical protein